MTEQLEYVIRADQLRAFEKNLPKVFDDVDTRLLIDRDEIIGNIRSRPVPPADAPEQPIESIEGMEHRKSRLAPDGSTSAPEREESRHTRTNLNEQHEATIRKNERERVLCELLAYIHPDSRAGDVIKKMLESLRRPNDSSEPEEVRAKPHREGAP